MNMIAGGTSQSIGTAGKALGIVRALAACGFAAALLAGCLPGRIRSAWVGGEGNRLQGGLADEGKSVGGPLAFAAMRGELDEARQLLDGGEPADILDEEYGNSPLMYAARQGHLEMAELLIERGADVNHRNRDGATVLMWAAGQGHVDMVKLLLDRGADVHMENKTGMTAIDYSDRSGNRDLETYLIQLAKAKATSEPSVSGEAAVNH